MQWDGRCRPLTDDVVGNVSGGRSLVIADDQSPDMQSALACISKEVVLKQSAYIVLLKQARGEY